MLVDANILVYAVDESSPHHERTSQWLTQALNGDSRVALPWQSLGTFLRITTHPRITTSPLDPGLAWSLAQDWLDSPLVWIPAAGARTATIFGDLVERHRITGNLIPDAQLAALAIEHGVPVVSADSDFARFTELRWINPVR